MNQSGNIQARALLIDLDDTLVAFDAVSEESWQEVCGEYARGRDTPGVEQMVEAIREVGAWYWSDPERRHRIGRNDLARTRRTLVANAFSGLGLPEEDALLVADEYSRVRLGKMYLIPGALRALETLRSRGITLALLTNGDGPGQRAKIERFGIAPHVDWIFIEGEIGHGKPDPRAYTRAAELMRREPAELCMVGDNIVWDVGGPQGVGMAGVWIDRHGEGLPADTQVRPDAIIPTIAQLPPLFA